MPTPKTAEEWHREALRLFDEATKPKEEPQAVPVTNGRVPQAPVQPTPLTPAVLEAGVLPFVGRIQEERREPVRQPLETVGRGAQKFVFEPLVATSEALAQFTESGIVPGAPPIPGRAGIDPESALGQLFTGRIKPTEAGKRLLEEHGQRPLAEQIGIELVFDPLNAVPGVGFTKLLRAANRPLRPILGGRPFHGFLRHARPPAAVRPLQYPSSKLALPPGIGRTVPGAIAMPGRVPGQVARGAISPVPSEPALILVTSQNPAGERLIFSGQRAMRQAAEELGQRGDVQVLAGNATAEDVRRAAQFVGREQAPGTQTSIGVQRRLLREGQQVFLEGATPTRRRLTSVQEIADGLLPGETREAGIARMEGIDQLSLDDLIKLDVQERRLPKPIGPDAQQELGLRHLRGMAIGDEVQKRMAAGATRGQHRTAGGDVLARPSQRQLPASLDPEDLDALRRGLRQRENRLASLRPGPHPNSPANQQRRALTEQITALRGAIADLRTNLPVGLVIPGVVRREPITRVFPPATQNVLGVGVVRGPGQPTLPTGQAQRKAFQRPSGLPLEASTEEAAGRLRAAVRRAAQLGPFTGARAENVAKEAFVAPRVPDPPPASIVPAAGAAPPPSGAVPPGGSAPPSGRPPVGPSEVPPLAARVAEGAFPWERPDQAALDLHASAITNEERRAGLLARDGAQTLKEAGVGRTFRGQFVPRSEDIPRMDELFDALHNPSEVAAGTRQVPAGLEGPYQELRRLTDWEEAARLDFDPEMATIQDYFYRGWKPPEGAFLSQQGTLVRNPAFRLPRRGATYREMRDAGFEPISWNPFEQWRISRMQGVKYRQQIELVEFLKGMGDELIQPHQGGTPPDGWRVPVVGPAFEGKPFAFIDATTGESGQGFTARWIVRDEIANSLENMYSKRPSLGKLVVGGKAIDPLAVIDWLTFVPKRIKLFGSLFQQTDFLTRAGAGSFSGVVTALRHGRPVAAVKSLIGYPGTARDIIGSFFSPNWRTNLARRFDDTTPITSARPGVHLRAISESGLNVVDPTLFGRDPLGLDAAIREIVQETRLARGVKALPRALRELERMSRQGLFGGVYPAAILNDVVKNIAPQMLRTYAHLSDGQLNRAIARAANLQYSSLPATQSLVQNRAWRETLQRVFFSLNENEGLLRQATNTLPVGFRLSKKGLPLPTRGGHFSKFWADRWLGAYLFLISTANVIHFASTGKPLPKDRYVPIANDKWGPLPFGYNTEFASPNIPLTGKGATEVMLDVVGQMDTALRVLNPLGFIGSRLSIPVRAFKNQVEAQDFYGRPIDEVGPGGVFSRTSQLIQDLFAPIGAGQTAANLAVQQEPALEPFVTAGEEKLGVGAQALQGLGVNVRAETIADAVRRQHPGFDQMPEANQKALTEKLVREVFGPKTRRDVERFQEKIWELFPPTDAQREAFEARMDQRFGAAGGTSSPRWHAAGWEETLDMLLGDQ